MKAQFTKQEIKETMDKFVEQKDKEIIAELYYLGVEFVNSCKTSGSYKDRTGNLRSSIGCAVMKDGEIIKSIHEGSSCEGVSQGKDFSEELRSQFPKGYFLIVFAGMHYALYVENRGYSVLTSFLPGSDEFIGMLKELVA